MPRSCPPPQCGSCHDEVAKEYATSIHGVSQSMGASGAATCADCHGTHDIVPVKQADSPVFKLNLPRTCARCHSNANLTTEYRMKFPQAAAQYMDSIHGRALTEAGPDRRPLLQRLPRRPRHPAQRGPRFADQPGQRRQDLRQVPRRRRGDL